MRTLHGGNGNRNFCIYVGGHALLVNDTSEPYEVQYGYNTVANGGAPAIILQSGEIAHRYSNGSSRDFAAWEIGDAEEFQGSTLERVTVSELERK